MNFFRVLVPLILAFVLFGACWADERKVCITIDDLPVVGGGSLARQRAVTDGLLNHLKQFKVPAIGFVNESKLGTPVVPARVELLRSWLRAGFELGNHTYGHSSFYRVSYAEFLKDFERGDDVIGPLSESFGKRVRYFRHPYLNTGPNLVAKQRFEKALDSSGYLIAPVTFDNEEWRYARAYDLANGDPAERKNIALAYLEHLDETFAFFEGASRKLLKREPAQILLLHANALNSHCLSEVLRLLKARGYRFISLQEALEDPVYTRRDTYTGRRGNSWLHRWAITEGKSLGTEPRAPQWIVNYR